VENDETGEIREKKRKLWILTGFYNAHYTLESIFLCKYNLQKFPVISRITTSRRICVRDSDY